MSHNPGGPHDQKGTPTKESVAHPQGDQQRKGGNSVDEYECNTDK